MDDAAVRAAALQAARSMPSSRARCRTAGAASVRCRWRCAMAAVTAAAGGGGCRGGGVRAQVGGNSVRRRLRRRCRNWRRRRRSALAFDANQHRPHRQHLPDLTAELDHAPDHRRRNLDRRPCRSSRRTASGLRRRDRPASRATRRVSTSAMPSPRSGMRTVCTVMAPAFPSPFDRPRPPAPAPESTPTRAHADTACRSPSRARSAPRGG